MKRFICIVNNSVCADGGTMDWIGCGSGRGLHSIGLVQ